MKCFSSADRNGDEIFHQVFAHPLDCFQAFGRSDCFTRKRPTVASVCYTEIRGFCRVASAAVR